jgi:hypothetical protein
MDSILAKPLQVGFWFSGSAGDASVFGAFDFYARFVPAFVEAQRTKGTTTWLYYQKLGIRSDIHVSDWTPMIITFLDGLAWNLGFVQLYERPLKGSKDGKRDCVWFKGNETDRLVAIEPENEPRYVWYSEVPKLLRDDAPLKVLITYHGYNTKQTPEGWRQDFLDHLKNEATSGGHEVEPAGDVEFLAILGDRVEDNASDWHGFALRRTNGAWDNDWRELGGVP